MRPRFTKKQLLIEALGSIRGIDLLKENKLTLVTPIGVITGKLADTSSEWENNPGESVETGSNIFSIVEKGVMKKIGYLEDGGELVEDAGAGSILLEDVEIHSPANFGDPLQISHLLVFPDQVIGVTIGIVSRDCEPVQGEFHESEDASRRLDTGHEFGD